MFRFPATFVMNSHLSRRAAVLVCKQAPKPAQMTEPQQKYDKACAENVTHAPPKFLFKKGGGRRPPPRRQHKAQMTKPQQTTRPALKMLHTSDATNHRCIRTLKRKACVLRGMDQILKYIPRAVETIHCQC